MDSIREKEENNDRKTKEDKEVWSMCYVCIVFANSAGAPPSTTDYRTTFGSFSFEFLLQLK